MGYLSRNKEHICIKNDDDYKYLLDRISSGPLFGESFDFIDNEYLSKLLIHLDCDLNEYYRKYYYYNKEKNIHISTSEFGYTWISTYGLISKGQKTENKLLNACNNQYVVIKLLIDKALDICKSNDIYDVDSFNFGYLSDFTPALFHNILFYAETFGKAYLSLCKKDVPRTHELLKVFKLVSKAMFSNHHNDSIFHAQIITFFESIIHYIQKIPGDFREQFVKYNDNTEDGTVILFDFEYLQQVKSFIDISNDFINCFYYEGNDTLYIRNNLLDRLLKKAKTDEEKKNIIRMYNFLVEG